MLKLAKYNVCALGMNIGTFVDYTRNCISSRGDVDKGQVCGPTHSIGTWAIMKGYL